MGLFSNIFKKKPGGTLVGNIIRSVTNAATGGILGNGAGMIPATQAVPGTVLAPSPQVITQAPVMQPILTSVPVTQAQSGVQGVIDSLGNAASQVAESATKTWLKKNWWMIALPGGVFIAIIAYLTRRRR